MLQKPHPKNKAKLHVVRLEDRLGLWLEGGNDILLHEGRTTQQRLQGVDRSSQNDGRMAEGVEADVLLFLQGLGQPVFCDSKFNQKIMLHQCRSRRNFCSGCLPPGCSRQEPWNKANWHWWDPQTTYWKGHPVYSSKNSWQPTGTCCFPARSGGLGIIQPTNTAFEQIGVSKKVTEPLVSIIPQQNISYPDQIQADQHQAKKAVCNCIHIAATTEAETIKQKLSSSQQVAMDQASWRGASSWLRAIPIAEYEFTLYKQAFQDALCIRYDWRPAWLPSHCLCGVAFSVNHTLRCPKRCPPVYLAWPP